MTRKSLFLLLILITHYSYASIVHLEQAYKSALSRAEIKNINESVEKQAKSRLNQSRALLFPNISLEGQLVETQFENQNNVETKTSRSLGVARLRQPLFKGGLFSAVDREKILFEASKDQVQKQNLELYQMVSQNYFRIVLLENTVELFEDIEKATARRVEDLRKWLSIGRSKRVDLLASELQLQNIKLELENFKTQLKSERSYFARLTGLSENSQLDRSLELPQLKPLNYYLEKMNFSPDLKIQEKQFLSAQKEVSISRSQHLPELNLDLEARVGEFSTTQEGREYVGRLTLTLPLFEGGRISSQTQEFQAKRLLENSRLIDLRKEIETQIKNNHQELSRNLELFSIVEKSLETAKKSYELYAKELNLGLVTNLDLLTSLTNYLDAKKRREDALYNIKISELRLAQLIGETK